MVERDDKKTAPPPALEPTRRDLLARAEELRATAAKILTSAGDLILIAERMPGASVKP